jgi:hypothetical protein
MLAKYQRNLFLMAVFGILGQSNCSDSSRSSSRVVEAGSASIGGTISGTLMVSEGAPASSVANANITVQNHPEIVGKTSADGSFVLDNVLPGTLNIIVTSSDGTSLTEGSAQYAKMFKDVVVRHKETNHLGAHEFKKSGAVSGKVTFFENANNLDLTGSDVYIPGTSYIAKTDENGAFTLAGLPEGTLTLKAQHTGFAILSLEVEIRSGETVDLGELPLSLSNGPEGGLSIRADMTPRIAGRTEKLSLSRKVLLDISFDKNSSLMKISDEPSFLNRNWVPVARTYEWTFESDGAKKLYVMFSDLNGLESSPYSDSILVDTEAPTLGSIQILNGWEQSAARSVSIDLLAADSGSGLAEVLFSNISDSFQESDKQSFNTRLDWQLSSSDGAKIVYAKVRDYAGRESTVVQDNINLASSGRTIVYATTYTEDIVLKKGQSPFWFKQGAESLIFKGRLTIEPGATVFVDDNLSVKFNGPVRFEGSAADPVTIRTVTLNAGGCMPGGGTELLFNGAPPGVTAGNVMRHVKFRSIRQIRLNGGLVEYNEFDGSGCTNATIGAIYKTGLDNLMVRHNTFNAWDTGLSVSEGDGNTSFINNSGTFSTGVKQSGTAANTTVAGNQFTSHELAANYDGLLSWDNNAEILGYAQNSFAGKGTTLLVDSGRSTDLNLTGLSISECRRPLYSRNNRTTTISQSTLNCEYADMSTHYSTASVIYQQNAIIVSKALITGGSSDSGAVQFTANKLTIDCGNSPGTYCDLFYAQGKECGTSDSGNHGCWSSSPSCYVDNFVNASLEANNIFCKGDSSSGCRGLTLHLAPNNANTEADESVSCDFNYGNSLQLSLDNNYWESSAGYKSIANGANLQATALTDNGYTASTFDTVTGLSANSITVSFLMPIAGQTMSFTGWPTSVSTRAFNTSAPP